MAQKILIKKSTVAAKAPTVAQLDVGELAVNTADSILYTKHSDGRIKRLSPTLAERTKIADSVSSSDSRLTDEREWSAATVPQEEAEAGTASTRRAWTAQRVRQAINAWWQLVTSGFGRNLIAATNEESARNVLQLGTAATTNNGTGYGQNIINSAVSGNGNISYSGTLQNNTTGGYNTAAGSSALRMNTTGHYNTASGASALEYNTTGDNNTAYGANALRYNTWGRYNTAYGANALEGNPDGEYNTAVGNGALQRNKVYSNCGGFGNNSQVTASNQIQLGNSSTTVYAYGAVQNRSDARDKTAIRDTVLGLDFINAIRPVDYKLDMREDYRVELGENPTEEQLEANKLANIQTDGTHTRKRYHHGVIAQQVAEAIDALGVEFGGFQDHSKGGGDDVLSIGYEEFIAPLIKAVQELSARVKELEIK